MSIVTTYKCDRCGAVQDNSKQMWEIAVLIQHIYQPGTIDFKAQYFNWLPKETPLWCRKCVDAVGLLANWTPPSEAPATPAPSLEDKLREIVREEIEASHG